jgi:dienelactone hydrolase
MADVILFHHVQGLTDGVRAFAGQLRAGGHTVHTPDLTGLPDTARTRSTKARTSAAGIRSFSPCTMSMGGRLPRGARSP